MNRKALTSIAPEIYRQRLMVEGHFMVFVFGDTIRDYFHRLTVELASAPTVIRSYIGPAVKVANSTKASMDSCR